MTDTAELVQRLRVFGKCTCDPAYLVRKLHDPQCWGCDIREDLEAAADTLEREKRRADELESDCLEALPGVWYMDLPDGGAPSLGTQVKRMGTDVRQLRARLDAIVAMAKAQAPYYNYLEPWERCPLDTALRALILDGDKP
jgi:hypothetical protein